MKILMTVVLLSCCAASSAQSKKGFEIVEEKDKKQVNILYNGKLLTAYCYYDSSRKPFLWPVNTVEGINVTRSYPFKMVPGERTDHPHHTGIWLNYESVNGLDFWNNSTAIPVERRDHYGTIVHKSIVAKHADANAAELIVNCEWIRPDKKVLLRETTVFAFVVDDKTVMINRSTDLVAVDTTVVFKDVKDGMFAIRVARELEMPSKEASKFVDDKGNVTNVPPSGKDATGMYYGSTGLKGDSVWGTKGNWAMLQGKKDGKSITIAIIDHPSNPGYPAYWHARGYGLFSINPLGRKIFSNGKEELNLALKPGQKTTFQYLLIVTTDDITPSDMDYLGKAFGKEK
jgi:hypothetical protein